MADPELVNLLTLTATDLQRLLTDGVLTSRDIVQQYLDQISRHNTSGLMLNAVISTPNNAELFRRAQLLDEERNAGRYGDLSTEFQSSSRYYCLRNKPRAVIFSIKANISEDWDEIQNSDTLIGHLHYRRHAKHLRVLRV